jgi:hypothetical protein
MKATQIIVSADGVWDWDDTNQSNLPQATTNLNANQADYQVMDETPSSGQDWLEITGVNLKDSSGNWYKLKYKANKDFSKPKQERDTTTGKPITYYFNGTQLFLDPMPNYSSNGGLEVLFNRAPLEFSSSDTTKRPGFNSLFHEYLVLKPTYWWEKYRNVGNPEQTKRDIQEMEIDMGKYYGNRSKYSPARLRRQPESFR